MKLDFRRCRELGGGLPVGVPGFQFELRQRPAEVIPLNGDCYHCGRGARVYIRRDGRLVVLCNWHATGRLPLAVRRSAFVHFRKVGT